MVAALLFDVGKPSPSCSISIVMLNVPPFTDSPMRVSGCSWVEVSSWVYNEAPNLVYSRRCWAQLINVSWVMYLTLLSYWRT